MQLDNGAFHKAQKLIIPENRVFLFQPAYSPDINPIERVWQHLKKESSWVNFNALAESQEKNLRTIEYYWTESCCFSYRISIYFIGA